MFATLEQTDVAERHPFRDPATGLRALIALHSTRLGPALGGCRCLPYPDEHTALNDVCRLARGMSYKAALAGLPLGGGSQKTTESLEIVTGTGPKPDTPDAYDAESVLINTAGPA